MEVAVLSFPTQVIHLVCPFGDWVLIKTEGYTVWNTLKKLNKMLSFKNGKMFITFNNTVTGVLAGGSVNTRRGGSQIMEVQGISRPCGI